MTDMEALKALQARLMGDWLVITHAIAEIGRLEGRSPVTTTTMHNPETDVGDKLSAKPEPKPIAGGHDCSKDKPTFPGDKPEPDADVSDAVAAGMAEIGFGKVSEAVALMSSLADATDAARALAKRQGVTLADVVGTGSQGMIRLEDVKAYIAERVDGSGNTFKITSKALQWAHAHRVPLQHVTGTGPHGVINEDDMIRYAKGHPDRWSE